MSLKLKTVYKRNITAEFCFLPARGEDTTMEIKVNLSDNNIIQQR